MFLLHKTKMILLFIIFFVISDRLLKALALSNYFDRPRYIFKNIFSLNFISNYNIAFSLPLSGVFLNLVIAAIIFLLVYYLINRIKNNRESEAIFFTAITLGAVSNFIDRLKYGYVIDYLDLKYFTVFNLADVLIVGGIAGLLWKTIKTK